MKAELAPGLDEFINEKLKTGNYQSASEVIRESLRRWKEQEQAGLAEPDWLEKEIREGLESPDYPTTKTFWNDLKSELHDEPVRKGKPNRR
jgi:putative addiction module CopG family antidote